MTHSKEEGPWLFVPNQRTGRLEVYVANGDSEMLVASMPGDATESDIRGMANRLSKEAKLCK